MSKTIPRRIRIAGILIVLLVGALGYVGWYNLFREVPTYYASAEEHFKYGSIGTEQAEGIPYWIWLVLPRLFPEKLPGPGGYTSLGIIWEEGQEMPMGFPKKTIGFPRVGVNCATCHITRLRKTAQEAKPTFILGGPSQQFDTQGYQRFLFACASDPRFTPEYILGRDGLQYVHQFSWFEKLLYRFVIIPQTRQALLRQKQEFAWQNIRPPHGPGRVDPFNPMKFRTFKLPEDHTIGNSDIPSIWNQKPRVGLSLHWDGLSKVFFEVAVSSAIGDGASRKAVDLEGLRRVEKFLMELPPPKYPYAVDQKLASRGGDVYAQQCASCHAIGQANTGKVIPVKEVGTDPHRVDAWTQNEVYAWKKFAEGYDFNFNTFSKTDGYVAAPLDGIWLRAPYLHNGSVPSLKDLLEVPGNRSKVFYRGHDVYDPEKVGFVSDEPAGFRYDTSVPGNGNGGHLYGTTLSPEDKKALVEYLKTL